MSTIIIYNCSQTQTGFFFKCYAELCQENLAHTILIYIFYITTIGLNLFVLISAIIVSRSHRIKHQSVLFDLILLSQTMANMLSGAINVPAFHVYYLFSYTWPLGYLTEKIWLVFEMTLIFVITFNWLYLCYVRLRSIQNPRGFQTEKLIKKPYFCLLIIWLLGVLIWSSIVIGFGIVDTKKIKINFAPTYIQAVFVSLLWLLPLCLTLAIAVRFIYLLDKLEKKKIFYSNRSRSNQIASINDLSTKETTKSSVKLNAKLKFGLVTGVYFILW
jgi:hypothetical protein